MHEIWPQFDDESLGYLVPSQLQRLIEHFTKAKISENCCQTFINSIDENRNNKIEKDEFSNFIGEGIVMDETQRSQYGARGETHETILSFFDAVKQQVNRDFNANFFAKSKFRSSQSSAPKLLFHEASHFPIAEEEHPRRYATRYFSDLHYHNYITATFNSLPDTGECNIAKIYLLDGAYLKIRFNKMMTFKHLCVTIKSILKLENDEDFSCYLCSSSTDEQSDTVRRLLDENDNVNAIINNITSGPFENGEHVLVSPIDANEDISTTVDVFLKREWYKFNNDLKPFGESHLRAFFDYYTQQATPQKMCKAFVNFIDTDNNSEITVQELGRYISMGIGMSPLERKDFASRNDANKILVSLFAEIEKRIYDEKVNAVVIECTKKGNPYLQNGHYKVEYFDYAAQKKVIIVACEKYIERLGKIVYRRNVNFATASFETEAKNLHGDYSYAYRLLFAEYYNRYVNDYFKSSVGASIEFAAILLLMDLIGYPHANLFSDNLLPYGHGLWPYVPRRILKQFCDVKRNDLLAQRIKEEAKNMFATMGEAFDITDLQYDTDGALLKQNEIKNLDDITILPYHKLEFLKFRQKLESLFIQKCEGNFPRIYHDIFFHVAIAEASLFHADGNKLDVLTSSDLGWQSASVGFGKEYLNVVIYESSRLSIKHSFQYKRLHNWACSANSCLLRIWYEKDQALIIKSFSVVGMEKVLRAHVEDINNAKRTGRQRRESRRYGKEELEELYNKFDVDSTGFLDKSKVQEMLATLGRPLSSPPQLSQSLANIDKLSKDKIYFKDFCLWWKHDYDNDNSISTPFDLQDNHAAPKKSNNAMGPQLAKKLSRPSFTPPDPPKTPKKEMTEPQSNNPEPTQPSNEQSSNILPGAINVCDKEEEQLDMTPPDPPENETIEPQSNNSELTQPKIEQRSNILPSAINVYDKEENELATDNVRLRSEVGASNVETKEVDISCANDHGIGNTNTEEGTIEEGGHLVRSVIKSGSESVIDKDNKVGKKQKEDKGESTTENQNAFQTEELKHGTEYGGKINTYEGAHKNKNSTSERMLVREAFSGKACDPEDLHDKVGNKTAAQGQVVLERPVLAVNRTENENSNVADDLYSNISRRNGNDKAKSNDKQTEKFGFFDQLGFFGMSNF